MSLELAKNIAQKIPPSIAGSIEQIPISELKLGSRQLRIRKKSVLDAIGGSIRQFGFVIPVLVDANNRIICGKGRVESARLVGMSAVPCVRAVHLSEAEQRALAIADNQLAQLAPWDPETLRLELTELSDMDLSFDLELTGFSSAKIDAIRFGGRDDDKSADAIPPLASSNVSQIGDLWLLGESRLFCGDATASASFEALLQGQRVRMVFTDPPYNVPVAGVLSG